MTPQEKAEDLFKKMYQTRSVAGSDVTKYFAKQSALVAVDEIMLSHQMSVMCEDIVIDYWKEVKQEIEKL
jgi:hypothetical protein